MESKRDKRNIGKREEERRKRMLRTLGKRKGILTLKKMGKKRRKRIRAEKKWKE